METPILIHIEGLVGRHFFQSPKLGLVGLWKDHAAQLGIQTISMGIRIRRTYLWHLIMIPLWMIPYSSIYHILSLCRYVSFFSLSLYLYIIYIRVCLTVGYPKLVDHHSFPLIDHKWGIYHDFPWYTMIYSIPHFHSDPYCLAMPQSYPHLAHPTDHHRPPSRACCHSDPLDCDWRLMCFWEIPVLQNGGIAGVPPGKLTLGPWKSPIFNGQQSSKPYLAGSMLIYQRVHVQIEHHPTSGNINSNISSKRYFFKWCSKSPKWDIYQALFWNGTLNINKLPRPSVCQKLCLTPYVLVLLVAIFWVVFGGSR